jgi:hypothetical protein
MINDAARLDGRAVPISVEAEDMGEYFFLEDEAAIVRHLGRSKQPNRPAYDRAWATLEDADERIAEAHEIQRYPADERWIAADRKARLKALAAVEDSRVVAEARRLAHNLRDRGPLRDYGKAVAARIAIEEAVWTVAYGRAMPKEWRVKS